MINSKARGARLPWPPRLDLIWVGVLWLLGTWVLAYSGAMADNNRDLYQALQWIQEGIYPLAGPAIDHRIHYGPLWFYLLGLPLLFVDSWLVTSLWAGFLISAVYPLSYALGRRLAGRTAGLMACALIALPSWTSVYYLTYSHPATIPASIALFGLAAHRWYRYPSKIMAVVLGLALSLVVHAHITAAGVGLILLPLIAVRFNKRWLALTGQTSLILLGLVIPLLPYLIQQAISGWPAADASHEYASQLNIINNIQAIPAVMRGLLAGSWFALRSVAELPVVAAAVGCIIVFLIWITTAWGLLTTIARRRDFAILGLIAVAFIGLSISAVVIRNFTPFYHLLGFVYIIALAGAIGLARSKAWVISTTLVLAITLLSLLVAGPYRTTKRGVQHIDHGMMMTARQWRWGDVRARWSLPAIARDDNARWLCRQRQPIVALGQWGAMLEISTLLESRIHCPNRPPEVYLLGGQGKTVAGLHRDMAKAIGIDSEHRIGPMRLMPAKQVLNDGVTRAVSDAAIYPPDWPLVDSSEKLNYRTTLAANEALIVVNIYNLWMPLEGVQLSLNQQPLAPLYDDGDSLAYRCNDCYDKPLLLEIQAYRPQWVQVFKVTVPEAQSMIF